MRVHTHLLRIAGAAILIAGLGATLPVLGEVQQSADPDPVAKQKTIPPQPIHQRELRAQCWQEGVKIIDQAGLQGLSLNGATRDQSVSFKRQGEGQPSTFLLPFADGLCLIQPDG